MGLGGGVAGGGRGRRRSRRRLLVLCGDWRFGNAFHYSKRFHGRNRCHHKTFHGSCILPMATEPPWLLTTANYAPLKLYLLRTT